MATKIEWNSFDYAARDVLDALLDKLGVSYREMENMTQGEVTYSRIRDIKMGNKAPVRLSEFLIICDVCGADPVQTVRGIIAEAKRIEEEQERERRVEETKRILKDDPMALTADIDGEKSKYVEYGDGDDPA